VRMVGTKARNNGRAVLDCSRQVLWKVAEIPHHA
jgi:hypothetical protein